MLKFNVLIKIYKKNYESLYYYALFIASMDQFDLV